ncbi:MAG: anaerobic ribonucleoside-triphosphate reductase activating protein [Clostridia bacterium]|nr:anaerobic ribonucleoside-triphosphate reductase activating protein [Clostridia bacterium]
MRFYGLQKMTLLDFPGKVACTLFTGGCNFRCPFCHNASLVTEWDAAGDSLSEEEVLAFLDGRRGLLDGVAVTGGEPLLNPDLPAFLKKVRALGFAVKLDTNGSFPDRLEEILHGGLADYVAVDLKNCPEKFAATVGLPSFDRAAFERSMTLLRESGVEYEYRTTVVKEYHTVADIAAAAQWIAGAPRYYLQAFVDSGALIQGGLHPVDKAEMEQMRAAAAPFVGLCAIRGV